MSEHHPVSAQPWHALLAPLPSEAIPSRKPVASPEILATPEGAAVAGWEQLAIELSAGDDGLRIAMVILDPGGKPIIASDWVLYRSKTSEGRETLIEWVHESVGGRLEADGTFRGTRWHIVTVETADGKEIKKVPVSSEPTANDENKLKALVAEILHRAPK